ncbi:MAG: hypothetical protein DGJ47_001058 [Rickettsiaceae bacterium]
MENIFKNKIYLVSLAALITAGVLINFCTKIYQCACFFSIITATSVFLSNKYGLKKASFSLALSLVIAALVTYNVEYKIHNVTYVGIMMTSFVSVFLSFVASALMFEKTQSNVLANSALVMFSASFIDGFIMSGYFVNKLSALNITSIFAQEIFFKSIYLTVFLVAAYGVKLLNSKVSKA